MTNSTAIRTRDQVPSETRQLPPDYDGKVETVDGSITLSTYFGGEGPRELLGFMVEMPAPCVNGAHFHDIDQFQIFLPNAGT